MELFPHKLWNNFLYVSVALPPCSKSKQYVKYLLIVVIRTDEGILALGKIYFAQDEKCSLGFAPHHLHLKQDIRKGSLTGQYELEK